MIINDRGRKALAILDKIIISNIKKPAALPREFSEVCVTYV